MRRAIIALPAIWLLLFLAVPMAIVLLIALGHATPAVPPIRLGLNLENFALLVADDFYLRAFAQSLLVAGIAALLCLIIGYPMAFAISRAPASKRGLLLALVILPFWTGFLLRLTAWIGLLKDDGWINTALGLLGLGPFQLLYTPFAMHLGIAYCYLPFMVLPLYARLSARDKTLEDAAADLGATPWAVFYRITLPLSLPGIAAGLALVFIPALGEFVIPELLGGPQAETLGRVLWAEFFANRDWPMASALAITLLALFVVPAAIWQWRPGGDQA